MTIQAGNVEVEVSLNLDPLRQGFNQASQIASDGATEINKAGQSASGAFDGFSQTTAKEFNEFQENAIKSLDAVGKKSTNLGSQLNKIGSSLKNISFGALTAGATAATGALMNLARKGIQSADFLETARTAMSGLTGSFSEGNKAMSEAAKFWQNNPFQRIDVTSATQQLIQFGRTTNDLSSDLKILGDVSLSTDMNIAELARYYARVSSSGRAMTMDLEMMSDRGVPIYRELEKQLNTTTEGVRKMASEGKINFEIFRKAMEGAVSSEAMAEYENTLARQMDRFKGSIQIIAGELAGYKIINNELVISEQGLEKAWTRLLKTVATGLRSTEMKEAMEGLGKALAKLVDTVTKIAEPAIKMLSKVLKFLGDNSELLLPILGGLAAALTNMASNIPILGAAINGLKSNFKNLKEGIKGLLSTKGLLMGFIGLLTVGFMDAMKTDEEFRKTIQELFGSLREVFNTAMEAVKILLPTVKDLVKTLADSGVIQGILMGVATALKGMAQALAGIEPETLIGLLSFFASMKMFKANPVVTLVSVFTLLFTYIKKFLDEGKSLPEALLTIGHNMMVGLFNGIADGAKAIWDFLKSFVNGIVSTFKKLLGIHSPSTVMYGIGENICLGLANGIEDSKSAVQLAMNNLAKDILSLSEKVIKNKVDFGVLDITGQYQEWKKVSRLFTQGSEQYQYAIEKMEEARKQANLQILSLQENYNNKLDETIDKIANMYGLFDEVDLSGGKDSQTILKNLDKQIAKMGEWAEAQEIISNLALDDTLKEELRNMGITQVNELEAISQMTSDELSLLNEMWLKKQKLANDAGVKQMATYKDQTLDQINKLKKGIDGETIDVQDVGGRLVSSIGEGITGALPTLDSAFAKLGDYIEKAKKELAKSGAGSESGAGGITSPTTDDPIKSVSDEVQVMAGKIKDALPQILTNALLGIAAAKILPKVLKKIGAKTFSGGLGGILGKLFGGGSNVATAAEGVGKTTTAVEKMGESATQIGNSTQVISKGLSKANSFLDTIKQGAQTVIWIAGAIGAMAVALWAAYNLLKDMDFGKFQLVMIEMVEAVAVFGALAKVADMLKIGVGGILVIAGIAADVAVVALACRAAYELMQGIDFEKYQLVILEMIEALGVFGGFAGLLGLIAPLEGLGLLVIAGIAGDIALIALACKDAYDKMKDIDFDKYQVIILEMIEALGSMGGFGALLGLLAPLEFLGWASILAICDELIRVSNALQHVYNTVPDDIDKVKKKIDLIKDVLRKIIDTNLGELIGSIVSAIEAGPLERTIDMYAHVGEQLQKLSKLSIDEDKVNANLDKVKSALEKVRSKTNLISGWLQAWSDEANASSVESSARIIIIYGEVVDALNKLSNLKVSQSAYTAIDAISNVVKYVKESANGMFSWFSNVGAFAQDVEFIKNIIKAFIEIVPTAKQLAEPEYDVSGKKDTIIKSIKAVEEIVWQIGECGTGGWIEAKEKDLGAIQSIINKFTEIIPVAWQVADSNVSSWKDTALNQIKAIEAIIWQIGECGTGGWIEAKEKDLGAIQSIINKFTEISPVAYKIAKSGTEGWRDEALRNITAVEAIIWQIGQVGADAKSWDRATNLGAIQSIINKFTELVPVFYQVKDTGIKDNQGDVEKNIDAVKSIISKLNSVSIKQNGTLADKEWAIGMAVSMVKKMIEFQKAIKELSKDISTEAVTNTISAMDSVFSTMSVQFNGQLSTFENIGFQIGDSVARGVSSKTQAMADAGLQLQASLWWAIENKIPDEYSQGAWMATQFGNGLKSVDFYNVGAAMQTSLWWGIQNRMSDEYYQGQTMGYNFRQGLYDIDYGNAGWWASQGFIDGAWAQYGNVYNTGWWIANNFLQGLRDRGRQGSPWKTTMESGNWAVEGLIEGIQQEEGALVNEATTLADQVIDAFTLDDITMKPALDVATDTLAPSMDIEGSYGAYGGNGNNVIIEQTNNNYTEYDVERVQQDLAWALSRV